MQDRPSDLRFKLELCVSPSTLLVEELVVCVLKFSSGLLVGNEAGGAPFGADDEILAVLEADATESLAMVFSEASIGWPSFLLLPSAASVLLPAKLCNSDVAVMLAATGRVAVVRTSSRG